MITKTQKIDSGSFFVSTRSEGFNFEWPNRLQLHQYLVKGVSKQKLISFYPPSLSEFSAFTVEQRATLLKYFDEYGMTSTHRRNIDLITQCAAELGTTIPKVKVAY